MKIHYYTKLDNSEQPWKDILISSQTDLDAYGIKPYISFKSLPAIASSSRRPATAPSSSKPSGST